MNRGPSLPELGRELLGVALGVAGHWLSAAGRALLKRG